MNKDRLIIAKKKFNSRLIVGTGKYKTMPECAKAIKLSGADIVTVAVRRVNITDKKKPFFGCITRLVYQKGLDLIAFAIEHVIKSGGRNG